MSNFELWGIYCGVNQPKAAIPTLKLCSNLLPAEPGLLAEEGCGGACVRGDRLTPEYKLRPFVPIIALIGKPSRFRDRRFRGVLCFRVLVAIDFCELSCLCDFVANGVLVHLQLSLH